MKGVAARSPAFATRAGRIINLEQRINYCRVDHQQAAPFAYESRELLALTAYVGHSPGGCRCGSPSTDRPAPSSRRGAPCS